ncbi:MAG: hypothetical protein LBS57_02335 [Treponema sp.]|jgi:hypothetical protein|nr:hypothetical protein [Treponema sp.]
MKLRTLSVLLALAFVFLAACDNPSIGKDPTLNKVAESFKAVTDITGVPASAAVGAEIDLGAALAVPDDATNRIIAWSLTAPGAGITAIPADGGLVPTEKGLITLTAAIADGAEQGAFLRRIF